MIYLILGFRLAVLAALFLSVSSLSAMPITLGDAGQYNAIVLGDMTGYMSDVEGRLAVGGDLNMDHFSVGLLMENSAGKRDDLIVGGSALIRNSRIEYGNAVVDGTADVDESVGFYSGDNPENTNGVLRSGSVLDFEALTKDLMSRSSAWGGLMSTGQTFAMRNDDEVLYDLRFKGGDGLNVFDVDTIDLSQPNKSITFDMPASGLALVNVFGADVSLFDTGFYHTAWGGQQLKDSTPEERHDGAYSSGIIFNFVEATNLDIFRVGIKGSILAPLASTSFYNGHVDGNLIVGSLNSPASEFKSIQASNRISNNGGDQSSFTGQVNYHPFRGVPQTAAAVHEPKMVLLLLIGACSLLLATRSQAQLGRWVWPQ